MRHSHIFCRVTFFNTLSICLFSNPLLHGLFILAGASSSHIRRGFTETHTPPLTIFISFDVSSKLAALMASKRINPQYYLDAIGTLFVKMLVSPVFLAIVPIYATLRVLGIGYASKTVYFAVLRTGPGKLSLL